MEPNPHRNGFLVKKNIYILLLLMLVAGSGDKNRGKHEFLMCYLPSPAIGPTETRRNILSWSCTLIKYGGWSGVGWSGGGRGAARSSQTRSGQTFYPVRDDATKRHFDSPTTFFLLLLPSQSSTPRIDTSNVSKIKHGVNPSTHTTFFLLLFSPLQ